MIAYHEYLPVEGAQLFTMVCLPQSEGTFPVVLYRSPYVDFAEEMDEADICAQFLQERQEWLQSGYAVVYLHCRGRGKSSGAA